MIVFSDLHDTINYIVHIPEVIRVHLLVTMGLLVTMCLHTCITVCTAVEKWLHTADKQHPLILKKTTGNAMSLVKKTPRHMVRNKSTKNTRADAVAISATSITLSQYHYKVIKYLSTSFKCHFQSVPSQGMLCFRILSIYLPK